MTLDEAIKHAEEVADKKEREKQKWERWLEHDSDNRAVAEKESCDLCAKEHRQLAEWLKELKQLREQEPKTDSWSIKDVADTFKKHGLIRAQESSGNAIDRKLVCAFIDGLISDDGERKKGLEYIRNMPPVNSQSETGHWIQTNEFFINQDGQFIYKFICSECKSLSYFRKSNKKAIGANVCPNCGCRMVEPQEGSDKE